MVSAAKRARSPETALDFDRPAKRLIIGMHEDAMDSGDFSDSSYGMQESVPSSRYPSEDWVRQTNGLSIDITTTPDESKSSNLPYEHSGLGAHSGDVDMMDSDENTQAVAIHTSLHPPDTYRFRQFANLPNRSHPYLHSPEISVTPATPTSAATSTAPSAASSIHDLSELRSSLVPSEGSSMSITTTTSFSRSLSPQSPLRPPPRPKFSMGPRADCEKCRLGVKGHYAHFD